ncbi:hypothetical protein BJX99DRAFT_258999 [Aspergillus californicus]
MAKKLSDFVDDTLEGLVSTDAFHQGLWDLCKKVVTHPQSPHHYEQMLDLREIDKRLKDYPDLFAALCFRELVKRPRFARELTFSYTTCPGRNYHLPGATLVQGLAALAYGIEEPEEVTDSPDQYTFKSDYFRQSLVAAAFFSARSLVHLEPLDGPRPSSADSSDQCTFRSEYSRHRLLADVFASTGNLEADELEQLEKLTVEDTIQDEARSEVATDPEKARHTKCRLGRVIGGLFGHEIPLDPSLPFWKNGLERWFFLLRGENFQRLEPHLSDEQARAARILLEWWHGSIDFEAKPAQSRAAVYQLAGADDYADFFDDRSDTYQNRMKDFLGSEFFYEFHSTSEPGDRDVRFQQAAVQRLAMAVYRSLISSCGVDRQSLDTENAMAGVEYDRTLGASASPCAWLPASVPHEDMPYYLWDIQERRTCVTKQLKERVPYTAISHTWGRWRKVNAPSVAVMGVEEWLIPQNTKFEVTHLPSILASAPLETRFVWFDLLCIPQGANSDRLGQISRDEIARQAKIFRGAEHAVAWLNDVDGWTGLHAALRFLSIKYLAETNEPPVWSHASDSTVMPTDLELISYDKDDVWGKVNGWFSSLWTLQELVLRPDMIFCDSQWNAFAVGGTKETAVRLDDFIALRIAADNTTRYSHRDPLMHREGNLPEAGHSGKERSIFMDALDELLSISGLNDFPNASRVTILSMGQKRYCESNRAEAIMSAVGAVDWYSSTNDSSVGIPEPRSNSLSVQKTPTNGYPQAFLQEVADRVGPHFYATVFSADGLIAALFQSLRPTSAGSLQGPATMLPFSFDRFTKFESVNSASGIRGTPHPSVRMWTINADLSVDIHQAAIISYTGQMRSGNHPLVTNMVAPYADDSDFSHGRHQNDVDLDNWVNSFVSQTRNFAVCLHYGLCIDGILLKELVTGDLVKVGTFDSELLPPLLATYPPPETYNVNWHVL